MYIFFRNLQELITSTFSMVFWRLSYLFLLPFKDIDVFDF